MEKVQPHICCGEIIAQAGAKIRQITTCDATCDCDRGGCVTATYTDAVVPCNLAPVGVGGIPATAIKSAALTRHAETSCRSSAPVRVHLHRRGSSRVSEPYFFGFYSTPAIVLTQMQYFSKIGIKRPLVVRVLQVNPYRRARRVSHPDRPGTAGETILTISWGFTQPRGGCVSFSYTGAPSND